MLATTGAAWWLWLWWAARLPGAARGGDVPTPGTAHVLGALRVGQQGRAGAAHDLGLEAWRKEERMEGGRGGAFVAFVLLR